MKLHYLLPLLILVVLPLRLYQLSTVPGGLYVDEASIGYNAYSLLKTGRDEYHFPLPIFLRSFGVYSAAPVVYMLTIPIATFGLQVFSIRLVALILGLLFCLAGAILATKLFPRSGSSMFSITFLVLALSPAHLLYSRNQYESSLALLLFTLSLVYLIRHRFSISLLLLSLSIYSYHSYRLIGYLLLALLIFKFKRALVPALILFFITQLPQLYLSTLAGPSQRFVTSTWLGQPGISPIRELVSQYISYYSPSNLFFFADSDPLRSLPDLSIYVSWLVVPYLLGTIQLIKRFRSNYLFWSVVLFAPVAAAFTHDPFSFLRANAVFLPTTYAISLGLVACLKNLRWPIVILTVISIPFICRSLFVLYTPERAGVWADYPNVFAYLASQSLPAVVDDVKPVYVLHLFYDRVAPQLVQQLHPLTTQTYYQATSWTNYYHDAKYDFRPIVWQTDLLTHHLLVGNAITFSPEQIQEHHLTSVFSAPNLMVLSTNPVSK